VFKPGMYKPGTHLFFCVPQVHVEEWAAMKRSVELLSAQNSDLLKLLTQALTKTL